MSSYLKFKDLGNPSVNSWNNNSFANEPPSAPPSGPPEGTQPAVHSGPSGGKKIVKIKSAIHKRNIISTNDIVVNDVYGKWCGPCKNAKPHFKTIASRYENSNVLFTKENVDDKISPDITGVPCFQFFVKGSPDGVISGADMKAIENKIQSYFT
jgi:thiol-disulfide isomerase/thioredoxin